jgi:hypothetical protein
MAATLRHCTTEIARAALVIPPQFGLDASKLSESVIEALVRACDSNRMATRVVDHLIAQVKKFPLVADVWQARREIAQMEIDARGGLEEWNPERKVKCETCQDSGYVIRVVRGVEAAERCPAEIHAKAAAKVQASKAGPARVDRSRAAAGDREET